MIFDKNKYQKEQITINGETIRIRSFRDLLYVKTPIHEELQKISIFAPEPFYEGKSINGYNINTAPVLIPNSVGGFLTAFSEDPSLDSSQPPVPNIIFLALQHGYVVVSPSLRGRTEKDKSGKFIGKAPSSIIDLKSVIRYLHFFASELPGDEDKIISNGTSAGGCLSALLGSTGNHPDYDSNESFSASDDVFASSVYCPIMNFEHADSCYEWLFKNVSDYCGNVAKIDENGKLSFQHVEGKLNEDLIELSEKVASLFPEYINSLDLHDDEGNKLCLDEDGNNGSFINFLEKILISSAQKAIEKGIDVSNKKWIKLINNKKVISVDMVEYVKELKRIKPPLVFDDLNNNGSINDLFGNEKTNAMHFTDFSQAKSSIDSCIADDKVIKLMNPMRYIDDDKAKKAKYWRIRQGTNDNHIPFVISALLAIKLKNNGADVDFQMTWETDHYGNYDIDELFSWIDHICK